MMNKRKSLCDNLSLIPKAETTTTASTEGWIKKYPSRRHVRHNKCQQWNQGLAAAT